MDINTIRAVGTVIAFLMFCGVVWWAYTPRRKQAFDEAANLPFADGDDVALNVVVRKGNGK